MRRKWPHSCYCTSGPCGLYIIFLFLTFLLEPLSGRLLVAENVQFEAGEITDEPQCPFCTTVGWQSSQLCKNRWKRYEVYVMATKNRSDSALIRFCELPATVFTGVTEKEDQVWMPPNVDHSVESEEPEFDLFSPPRTAFPARPLRYRRLKHHPPPPPPPPPPPSKKFSTAEAQQLLYKWQHPASCEGQKFLVLIHGDTGFGSLIHAVSWAFNFALNSGRILVFNYNMTWAPEPFGMEYYFKDFTNCTLETPIVCPNSDWRNVPDHLINERCVSVGVRRPHPGALKDVPRQFSSHQLGWWRSQCFYYLMSRLQPHIYNYIRYHRALHRLPVDSDTICMHVRRSDKSKVMQLQPLANYVAAAREVLNTASQDRDGKPKVFITTESDEVLNETLPYTHEFDFLFFPEERRNEDHVTASLRHTGEYIGLLSLINLSYQLQCRIFIGTRRSNWSRVIDRLKALIHPKSFGYRFLDLSNMTIYDPVFS